jgi:hypothetical protein
MSASHSQKKNPKKLFSGFPNKKPREDLGSTRGFATRPFYPGGSRLKKLKKPQKAPLWDLAWASFLSAKMMA